MKYKYDSFDPNHSQGKIVAQIKPNSKVLECGCATGYMTKYMKEMLNCQVSIIEYDESGFMEALQYASDGICCDLSLTDWYEKYRNYRFDYILFADVLEHLIDPLAVLKKATSLLNDSGSILVSLPNVGHNDIVKKLIDGNWDYTPLGLLDNTHVHFFAINNLEDFFAEAGLKIVLKDCTTVGTSYTEQYSNTQYCSDPVIDDIFKRRPEGEIYQFVLTLQKETFVVENNIPLIDKFPIPILSQENMVEKLARMESELIGNNRLLNERLEIINTYRTEHEQLVEKYQQLSEKYQQLSEDYQQLSEAYQQLSEDRQQLFVDHQRLNTDYQQTLYLAESKTLELNLVYNSTSWKITRPLRRLKLFFNKLLKKE